MTLRRGPGPRVRIGIVLFCLALAAVPAAAAGPDGAEPATLVVDLTALRALYLEAVTDESTVARGLRAIDELRRDPRADAARVDATLDAYAGALVTLRAKHAVWPGTKLRHMREGLEILDGVVKRHPDHVEARYLRLMSCYYLPTVLGRKWSVREDFAALGRLLPAARGEYPPDLYAAVARFVVERGRLPAEQRRRLASTLAGADG